MIWKIILVEIMPYLQRGDPLKQLQRILGSDERMISLYFLQHLDTQDPRRLQVSSYIHIPFFVTTYQLLIGMEK